MNNYQYRIAQNCLYSGPVSAGVKRLFKYPYRELCHRNAKLYLQRIASKTWQIRLYWLEYVLYVLLILHLHIQRKKLLFFFKYKVYPSRTEHVVTTWRFQLPSHGESNLVWQNSAALKPDKRADVWKAVTLWESLQKPAHLQVKKSSRAKICRT